MNERDFIYWLRGFLEVGNPKEISYRQLQIIKDHLDLVMEKKTPERNDIKEESIKQINKQKLKNWKITQDSIFKDDILYCSKAPRSYHSERIC